MARLGGHRVGAIARRGRGLSVAVAASGSSVSQFATMLIEPSTIASTLAPMISERACLRSRLGNIVRMMLGFGAAISVARAGERAGASLAAWAARRAAAMKFDLPPGSANDRRLDRAERRLGCGDALRRRSGIAAARHARFERMVRRQIGIDRPALAGRRRAGPQRRGPVAVDRCATRLDTGDIGLAEQHWRLVGSRARWPARAMSDVASRCSDFGSAGAQLLDGGSALRTRRRGRPRRVPVPPEPPVRSAARAAPAGSTSASVRRRR